MAMRVNSMEGYGALAGREPRPPRAGERDFVPVILGQRVRGEGSATLPAQRRAQVAGDAALAGARRSEQPQDPYQIWPEHEKPTDNWL